MGKESKVCVIMPVYNGAKTIELALKSLVAQSYTHWQCVIVNDGSTDGTKAILDQLQDPRFLIIHLEQNRGRGYARQVALEHTSGDYLAYLDADDFYHSEKLKSQVRILDEHPEIHLVSCRCVTYEKGFIPRDSRGGVTTPTLYHFPDPLRFVMPCSLVRLKEAKQVSYSRILNGPEDRDYFERYLDGRQYMSLDEPLFFYCLDETNYQKVLAYTAGNVRHAFSITRRNFWGGIRVVVNTSFKWVVYALFIPILGVEFFLRRRGIPVSDAQKELLRIELEKVTQITLS